MNNKEYNGWYNYETWVVSLWMDNEQGTYDYWRSVANDLVSLESPEFIADANTRACRLADRIKDEHEQALPELQGFPADLLNAAMSEVNWYEIAEHLLESVLEAS